MYDMKNLTKFPRLGELAPEPFELGRQQAPDRKSPRRDFVDQLPGERGVHRPDGHIPAGSLLDLLSDTDPVSVSSEMGERQHHCVGRSASDRKAPIVMAALRIHLPRKTP